MQNQVFKSFLSNISLDYIFRSMKKIKVFLVDNFKYFNIFFNILIYFRKIEKSINLKTCYRYRF